MSLIETLFGSTETEPEGNETTTEDVEPSPTLAMDLDEVLTLISNERRRVIIQTLSRAGHRIPKRDLVNHVAAHEYRNHPRRLDGDQRKRVHVALHQTHLPILDDAGVLDFDPTGIKPNPEADALVEMIDAVTAELQGGEA